MIKHDSMTRYLTDRAPALAPLAPFNFFHSEPMMTRAQLTLVS